jgi:hypothetical protein
MNGRKVPGLVSARMYRRSIPPYSRSAGDSAEEPGSRVANGMGMTRRWASPLLMSLTTDVVVCDAGSWLAV